MPTRLVIEILEAKNYKEAKRIIASIGKAKGGGNADQSGVSTAETADKDKPSDDLDSSDDEGFLSNLNMYVNSQILC